MNAETKKLNAALRTARKTLEQIALGDESLLASFNRSIDKAYNVARFLPSGAALEVDALLAQLGAALETGSLRRRGVASAKADRAGARGVVVDGWRKEIALASVGL